MQKQEKEKKQTYREAVQNVIREIWTAYDKAGALRDAATDNEKDTWNMVRGKLYEGAVGLVQMDDAMSEGRAMAELNGRY